MSLKVISFATYLSDFGSKWRQGDYDANKFVKALKGEEIRGFARVPVRGARLRLEQANADDATLWFGTMAADYIEEEGYPRPLTLIPVPNSHCVKQNAVPRTIALAEALAARLRGVDVVDALRWRVAFPSASREGGTRDPRTLFENLRIVEELPGSELILVDDVKTSGGHLRAIRAFVLEKGGDCDTAICAGRTVWDQEQRPFSLLEEELDDFDPE